MRKLLRRIFHKHQYVFCGKFYKGNDEIGHTEECYIFGCKVCKKTKKIKVVEWMAELIDKGAVLVDMNALLEELEDYIEYDAFDQYQEEPLINMSFETLEDVITSQPTVTEAEIRAKAISDFLQFVYDNASNEEYANEDGWAMSDLIDLEYKFLEQLKERE